MAWITQQMYTLTKDENGDPPVDAARQGVETQTPLAGC